MTEPSVSIITPTYNHGRYITQCIQSVLSQSYVRWELLVMDDESTDWTPEAVHAFADDRIRHYRQSHRGVHGLADTYNDALRLARGEIVAILEGDDFWPADKLQRMVPSFDDPRVVLAYGLARVVRSDGTPTNETIPSRKAMRRMSSAELHNDPIGRAIRPMLLPDPGVFTYPCTLLLRRSTLESIGGFQTVRDRHAVDWATCLQLALIGQFAFIPEVMGFWRRHATSVNSSLRLEEYLREDYLHVRTFATAHQQMLGISIADLNAMEQAWIRFWSHLWRMQGRYFLLQGEWQAARNRFRRALQNPDSLKGRLGALAGLGASYAHRDIEWLWRGRGKSVLSDEV